MSASHILVSCDTHKNNIFSGFSHLQQHQEFVDLTLAADGHLVKVHKNIIALASPYLKEMLQSAPTQYPVIFLNNVPHNELCYLLEYIYHGEVNVPIDHLESFMQVSQSLHITGIKNLILPTKVPLSSSSVPTADTQNVTQTESLDQIPPKINSNIDTSMIQSEEQTPMITPDELCNKTDGSKNFAACITINSDNNFEVQQFADNIQVLNTEVICPITVDNHDPVDRLQDLPIITDYDTYTEMAQTGDIANNFNTGILQTNNMAHNDSPQISLIQQQHPSISSGAIANPETPLLDLTQPSNLDKASKEALKIINQFTVSERGKVNIIVSRNIYTSHHNSRGGRKHRWRCIDYRKLQCPAFIDSLDDRIIARKGLHNHAFHDDRIYKKYKEGKIFHSIAEAKSNRDPIARETAVEGDLEKDIKFNIIPSNIDKM